MYASVMAGSRKVSPPQLLGRLTDSQKDRIDPLTIAPLRRYLAQAGRRDDAAWQPFSNVLTDKTLPQKAAFWTWQMSVMSASSDRAI